MKINNKIIFLDHDGVICLDNNWGGRSKKWAKWKETHPEAKSYSDLDVFHRFDDFDKNAIVVLNEILTETDAEIVISSDWRKQATLEELGEYYESQGIIKKPIGFTKSFIGCDKPENFVWDYYYKYEQERSIEINQYLTDHPEITHWVAIDDLHLAAEESWGLKNFIHTLFYEGLREEKIKEKIISFFK